VTGPGRLAVLVPTTGAILRILTLVPRPGLPHGAAFAEGDYRPLPLSPDYRALTGPEGPVARHLGGQIAPHELRLSGAPDSGRSWEVPVALAHLLLARGWTLTPDWAAADLVIWATGAVDLDLTMLPGDYAPERKVALSTSLLAKARKAVAILPPGPGFEAAEAALTAAGIATLSPKTLTEALAALTPAQAPQAAKVVPAPKAAARNPIVIVAALVAATAVAAGIAVIDLSPKAYAPITNPKTPVAAADDPPMTNVAPAPIPAAQDAPRPSGEVPPPDPMDAPPPLTLSEIHAAPGASCRAALFDPAQRHLTPLLWTPEGFPPSTFAPDLCGMALATTDGSPPPALTVTPSNAFVIADAPSGSVHALLSAGVQNVVYTFPDPRDGATQPLSHEIKQPN